MTLLIVIIIAIILIVLALWVTGQIPKSRDAIDAISWVLLLTAVVAILISIAYNFNNGNL